MADSFLGLSTLRLGRGPVTSDSFFFGDGRLLGVRVVVNVSVETSSACKAEIGTSVRTT